MPIEAPWRQRFGQLFSGTSALVTGGAGFIGSHISIALHALGANVTVLDDLSGGGDPSALDPDIQFVKGSILDQPLLERVSEGRALIFHQAALGSVPRSIEQPRLYHEVNVTGTLNVLEAARRHGVRRVMFAASSSAYGNSPLLPKVESMPVSPLSPYAATKVAGEALMAAYAAGLGVDTVSLRYFNIFGPRQNANSAYAAVIGAFAWAILGGKAPIVNGDGEQSRDFTYVDNAVQANLLAAARGEPLRGAIVNVACGVRISVNELARQMAVFLGVPNLEPIYAAERAGDVRHSLADLTCAEQLIGYRPIVGFNEGLGPTMRFYQEAAAGRSQ